VGDDRGILTGEQPGRLLRADLGHGRLWGGKTPSVFGTGGQDVRKTASQK
jgi:hypothetical protein